MGKREREFLSLSKRSRKFNERDRKSVKKQYDFDTGPSRATYADIAVVSSVFIAIVLAVTWALS